MSKKIIFILLFIFSWLLFAGKIVAQDNLWADSLRNLYKTVEADNEKLHILKQLSCELKYSDFESAVFYGNKAIEIARKTKDESTEANIHNCLGLGFSNQKEFQKSFKHFTQAEKLYQKANNHEMIGVIYNNLGLLYNAQSDFATELTYHQKALEIFEKHNIPSRKAMSYINIGKVYTFTQDYKTAGEFFIKAYKIYDELGDYKRVVTCLNNIAAIYQYNKEYELSLFYFEKNLELLDKMDMERSKAMVLYNMSAPLMSLNHYKEAEERLLQALEIGEKINDPSSIAIAYHNLGNLYAEQEKHQQAEEFYEKSLPIAIKIKMKDLEQENYKNLSKTCKEKGDYKKAYDYHVKFTAIKDSIFDEQIKKVNEVEKKYLEEKSAREIEAIQLEKQQEEYQSNLVKTISIAVIILMIISIFFIYSKYQDKKKTSQQLEEKNKEITDSITYAKRIQEAIVPTENEFVSNFPEAFVLYLPKDIVAGDFYWVESLPLPPSKGRGTPSPSGRAGEGSVYFAAADCTGHGVPGAMVSVVCSNALTKALLEENILETGKILDKTRELVIQQFAKSEEDVKDGMDIALCNLKLSESSELSESYAMLQYSGANNPLWIIRNDELIEIKPDKQPIGKTDYPTPFSTHNIELQKGDSIYVFSDGYQDQFGGESGKKFKTANLKKLLLSIQNKNMNEQKEVLKKHFFEWKGSLEQLDDVCFIGIKI